MLAQAAFVGDGMGPNHKRAELREGLSFGPRKWPQGKKTLPYDYGETAKPVTM